MDNNSAKKLDDKLVKKPVVKSTEKSDIKSIEIRVVFGVKILIYTTKIFKNETEMLLDDIYGYDEKVPILDENQEISQLRFDINVIDYPDLIRQVLFSMKPKNLIIHFNNFLEIDFSNLPNVNTLTIEDYDGCISIENYLPVLIGLLKSKKIEKELVIIYPKNLLIDQEIKEFGGIDVELEMNLGSVVKFYVTLAK